MTDSFSARLIGPRRRLFQGSAALLLFGIPFVRVGGESLLRFDLPTHALLAGGRSIPLEELYLFLPAVLALVLLFLLVTLAFGRAWCGWACPQTVLTDLVEGFARRTGGTVRGGVIETGPVGRILLHLFCAGLALLVAANLVWYVLSPYEFFPRLFSGTLPPAALWTLGLTAAPVYLDLALVRRLLCREVCPYGRFQTALADAGTLTLRFHPDEAPRCIRCGACVRACPTGIDIRQGDQIACINCGRCLDACRQVMARRSQAGIIRYTFGTAGRGVRALLHPRLILLAVLFLGACALTVSAVATRSPAILKVGRPAAAPVRLLADGRTVNLFMAVVGNRQTREATLSLSVRDGQGGELEALGPVREMRLAPGERRRIDFSVALPPGSAAGPIHLLLFDGDGRLLAEADARLLPPPAEGRGERP